MVWFPLSFCLMTIVLPSDHTAQTSALWRIRTQFWFFICLFLKMKDQTWQPKRKKTHCAIFDLSSPSNQSRRHFSAAQRLTEDVICCWEWIPLQDDSSSWVWAQTKNLKNKRSRQPSLSHFIFKLCNNPIRWFIDTPAFSTSASVLLSSHMQKLSARVTKRLDFTDEASRT